MDIIWHYLLSNTTDLKLQPKWLIHYFLADSGNKLPLHIQKNNRLLKFLHVIIELKISFLFLLLQS